MSVSVSEYVDVTRTQSTPWEYVKARVGSRLLHCVTHGANGQLCEQAYMAYQVYSQLLERMRKLEAKKRDH